MLLTVTTTHRPATDLGYLLHKHPELNAVYRSAMAGTWVARPDLAETPILLEARPPAVPARGGEPLYRVHECAFAVLALESDPVDPRL